MSKFEVYWHAILFFSVSLGSDIWQLSKGVLKLLFFFHSWVVEIAWRNQPQLQIVAAIPATAQSPAWSQKASDLPLLEKAFTLIHCPVAHDPPASSQPRARALSWASCSPFVQRVPPPPPIRVWPIRHAMEVYLMTAYSLLQTALILSQYRQGLSQTHL